MITFLSAASLLKYMFQNELGLLCAKELPIQDIKSDAMVKVEIIPLFISIRLFPREIISKS
jgi:hypothetical protein